MGVEVAIVRGNGQSSACALALMALTREQRKAEQASRGVDPP